VKLTSKNVNRKKFSKLCYCVTTDHINHRKLSKDECASHAELLCPVDHHLLRSQTSLESGCAIADVRVADLNQETSILLLCSVIAVLWIASSIYPRFFSGWASHLPCQRDWRFCSVTHRYRRQASFYPAVRKKNHRCRMNLNSL